MEMPARATPRSEEMTTGLLAPRRSGHARDIEKQILRFAQNDKRSANDSLAPSPLAPSPSPLPGEGRGEGGFAPGCSHAVIPACSLLSFPTFPTPSFPTFLMLSFPTLLIGNPRPG